MEEVLFTFQNEGGKKGCVYNWYKRPELGDIHAEPTPDQVNVVDARAKDGERSDISHPAPLILPNGILLLLFYSPASTSIL